MNDTPQDIYGVGEARLHNGQRPSGNKPQYSRYISSGPLSPGLRLGLSAAYSLSRWVVDPRDRIRKRRIKGWVWKKKVPGLGCLRLQGENQANQRRFNNKRMMGNKIKEECESRGGRVEWKHQIRRLVFGGGVRFWTRVEGA